MNSLMPKDVDNPVLNRRAEFQDHFWSNIETEIENMKKSRDVIN